MVNSWKMAGENDEFLRASVGLSVRKFIIFDRVEEMSRQQRDIHYVNV